MSDKSYSAAKHTPRRGSQSNVNEHDDAPVDAQATAGDGKRPFSSRAWPHVLLAGGVALVITLLVTSYLQSSTGFKTLEALSEQANRLQRIDHLQIVLVDAETGVRGYLLTGDGVYLAPFDEATKSLAKSFDEVRKDFLNLPEYQSRVSNLSTRITENHKGLAEAIARRKAGDAPDFKLRDENFMSDLRTEIADLRNALVEEGQRGIEQSTARFRMARNFGIAMATGTLLLLVALFSVLLRQTKLRERIANILEGENARLEQQVRGRTAELQALAHHLANAREAEKARLARELHDELGALLTAAKLDASAIARKLPEEAQAVVEQNLDRLQHTLTDGIALKRRIIDDLRPPLLKDLGLAAALEALCTDSAIGKNVRADCVLPDDVSAIDGERALALYRIAQEAFTNMGKYSGATEAKLELTLDEAHATLEISDNGRGFDPKAVSSGRHGIDGMNHRVQTYAGEFSLESVIGKGTCIRAVIPLK